VHWVVRRAGLIVVGVVTGFVAPPSERPRRAAKPIQLPRYLIPLQLLASKTSAVEWAASFPPAAVSAPAGPQASLGQFNGVCGNQLRRAIRDDGKAQPRINGVVKEFPNDAAAREQAVAVARDLAQNRKVVFGEKLVATDNLIHQEPLDGH
jgi:hypothetical protein